jgi:hypothetical protein
MGMTLGQISSHLGWTIPTLKHPDLKPEAKAPELKVKA